MKSIVLVLLLTVFLISACRSENQPASETEQETTSETTTSDTETDTTTKSDYVFGEWITDHAKALQYAKELNRPILMNFTGSDWCIWCIKLNDEVFSKQPFQSYAKKELVLLKLDFPRKLKLPADLVAQNNLLMNQYGIEGFPTIVLVDSKGTEINRTGYQSGGAEAYVKHLRSLLQ